MGDLRRIALATSGVLIATVTAVAQPAGGGGEVEMDPEPAGSAAGSGSGSAQPAEPVKDPKAARKWASAAQTLVQKGDYYTRANKADDAKAQYENAVTAYGKAIEADTDPSYYLSLAAVEDKLGHDADAYRHLKQIVDPKTAAKPDLVKKAQAKLDELSMKVGLVTLVIKPDGTQLSIAGKDVGETPLADPLVLDPGTYTLSLAAVGYQPKDVELKIEAGSEEQRKIDLEPVPIAIKPHEVEEAPAEAPKPPSKLPMYIGAGATGALVVTATITGILAVKQHHTFTAPGTNGFDRLDAQSNGKTLAHVTDICLGGAVVAAGFTAYWYFMKYQPALHPAPAEQRVPPPVEAKVELAPWVQPGAGGITAVGSF